MIDRYNKCLLFKYTGFVNYADLHDVVAILQVTIIKTERECDNDFITPGYILFGNMEVQEVNFLHAYRYAHLITLMLFE